MKTRPGLPALGWLFFGALGIALAGPIILYAQTAKRAASSDSQAASQDKPKGLAATVREEFKQIFSRLRGGKNPEADRKAGDRVRPTLSTSSDARPTARRPKTNSRVTEELQKIYKRDGRQMPPMQLRQLPRTPEEARQAVRNRSLQLPGRQQQLPTYHPRRAFAARPAGRQTSEPGFLDRLFGATHRFNQARPVQQPPQRQAQVPPMPSPANGLIGSSHKPGLLPGLLHSGRPVHKGGPRRTATAAATTHVKFADKKQAGSSDGFENPFSEMSEAEADRRMGYRGELELDEPADEGQMPIIRPGAGHLAANGQQGAAQRQKTNPASHTVGSSGSVPPASEAEQDGAAERGRQQKLALLAERAGQTGLKGFCPVVLRDDRDLADVKPEFSSEYNGKTYQFSSAEAKARFDADPAKYAPVSGGNDIIVLTTGDVELEGSLDHAVWYKERLYLFSSDDTLKTFARTPDKYAVPADSTTTGNAEAE